jgi:hypothetical protein
VQNSDHPLGYLIFEPITVFLLVKQSFKNNITIPIKITANNKNGFCQRKPMAKANAKIKIKPTNNSKDSNSSSITKIIGAIIIDSRIIIITDRILFIFIDFSAT